MRGKNYNYWFVLLVLICLISGICGCRKTNQLEFEERKLISAKDEYMMSAGDDENFFFINKDSGNVILIPDQYIIDYLNFPSMKTAAKAAYSSKTTIKL